MVRDWCPVTLIDWLVQFLRPRVEAPYVTPREVTPDDVLEGLHELAETWSKAEREKGVKFPRSVATAARTGAIRKCGRELAAVLERGSR